MFCEFLLPSLKRSGSSPFRWSSGKWGIACVLATVTLLHSGCGSFKKDKGAGIGEIDATESPEASGSDSFVSLCQSLGESGGGAVTRNGGWLFSTEELREIGKSGNIPAASRQEVVACITDYHEQLRKAGIELIVAPIPQKAIIYSEEVGARTSGRLDSYLQELYLELGSKGVGVVDLVPDLRRDRGTTGGVFPKTASHLSPKGAEVAAGAIVSYAKGHEWARGLEPDPNLVGTPMQITLLGNLAAYIRGDTPNDPETLPIRAIGRRTVGGLTTAARAGDGRIILITSEQDGLAYGEPGNPAGYDADLRGSLADQLTFELGTPVDVYSHATSGANTARVRLLRASMTKPTLLENTAVIIWCFSANELTRPDWRKVPLNLEFRQSEETIDRDADS
ncbi:MAG: hypothetical protein O3C21_19315 [Verrucomicrobia bacterium]|nr:hypothetical protein [Verrucomicrobiota bacterium]